MMNFTLYNRMQDNTGLLGHFVQAASEVFFILSSQEKMIYLFTTNNTTVM